MPVPNDDDTLDETVLDRPTNLFVTDELDWQVTVAAKTHVGKVRQRNEDHYAVVRRTRQCEILLSNLQLRNQDLPAGHAYGLLVADGVGGAKFGDFASHLVLETTLQAANQVSSWLMKNQEFDEQEIDRRVGAFVQRIRDEFDLHAELDPEKQEMGTTLTTAYLLPPLGIISHVGDSRAYLYREPELKQITQDHTLAQKLQDAGSSPEEVSQFANVLVNSFDSVREDIEVDVSYVQIQDGDRLLLCTDGLSDMVEGDAIARILRTPDLQTACDELVDAALDNGGKDNVTVILAELGSSPRPA